MKKELVFLSMLLTANAAHSTEHYVARLDNRHEVAAAWKSQQSGSGVAQIRLSDTGTMLDLDMEVSGVSLEQLAPAGPKGALGAIHIYNMPQNGPNFFVLQLPGTYVRTKDGFRLSLVNWKIPAPAGGAKVSAESVVKEIKAGHAYFGLHTADLQCLGSGGKVVACAAPATALSGRIVPE
jgi:hypothetical protein